MEGVVEMAYVQNAVYLVQNVTASITVRIARKDGMRKTERVRNVQYIVKHAKMLNAVPNAKKDGMMICVNQDVLKNVIKGTVFRMVNVLC